MDRLLWLCLVSACGPKAPDTRPAAAKPSAADADGEGSGAVVVDPDRAASAALGVDRFVVATEQGDVSITPVYHASTLIEFGRTTVWIDPWSKGDLDDRPKADLLIVTDVHFDHLDKDAIAKVVRDDTVIVAPPSVAAEIGRPVQHVLANGEQVEVAGITIRAVPMYNNARGPAEGGVFHQKGRGNGYVLTFGSKRIYSAGDTECTDEMKALTDIDVAFVPMNLPYTMPPEEAAACVATFSPAMVVPYHHAGSDLTVFTAALDGKVPVTVADFYPGGLPW